MPEEEDFDLPGLHPRSLENDELFQEEKGSKTTTTTTPAAATTPRGRRNRLSS